MAAREYDLIVWGATGFTGSLMCKHLAQHAPPELRWAVAGRRADALHKLVAELASLPSTRCPPGGIKVADAVAAAADAAGEHADAIRKMVASTRVVLAAAGPFPIYSKPVLAACAVAGTHYVDITGEVVPYVRDSVRALHEQARATGAKIVHCAGYDSVPSDLLSLLAIDALRAAGQRCSRCIVAYDLLNTVGYMSSGTLLSIVAIMRHLHATPADIPDALDPLCLCEPRPPRSTTQRVLAALTGGDAWVLPGYSPALHAWHFFFGMAAANTRIVRRSRHLLSDVPAHFAYYEVMSCGGGAVGLAIALASSLGYALCLPLLLLPPVRWLLTKCVPPGLGPSPSMQAAGRWRCEVAADGDDGNGGLMRVRGSVVGLGQDPGYKSTSMMAAQTALCVAEQSRAEAEDTGNAARPAATPSGGARLEGGGVMTPAAACGAALVGRFAAHGVHFKVGAPEPRPTGLAAHGWLLLVLLSWAWLGAVTFVRAPELVALCRSAANLILEALPPLQQRLSTATLAAGTLAAALSFLFYLPLRATRRHLVNVPLAILVACGLVAVACDGPLLWRPASTDRSLEGRVILITGGNGGLGLGAAKTLVAHGATVLLACRTKRSCDAAVAEVAPAATRFSSSPFQPAASFRDGHVAAVQAPLDLADLRSVRAFATALRQEAVVRSHRQLDVLLLNAGFAAGRHDGRPRTDAQGIELSLGSMHVGHALLTRLLMPLLERGGGGAARIVSVSSEASHAAKPLHPSFFRDLGEGDLRGEITHNDAPLGTAYLSLNLVLDVLPRAFSALGATGFVPTYMRAKYANVLYARALSERLNRTHAKHGSQRGGGKRRVISAVAGPGFVSTPILTATGMSGLSAAYMRLLAAMAMRAPRNGVAGIVRAVMDAEDAVAGKFIDSMAVPRDFDHSCLAAGPGGCSSSDAQRLYQVTERLMRAVPASSSRVRTASDATLMAHQCAASAPPPPPSMSRVLAHGSAAAAAAALAAWAAAALAATLALSWRRRRMRRLRQLPSPPPLPACSPPGALLNSCNQLAHLPVLGPLLKGAYWSLACASAPLLAPLALLRGFVEAGRDAAASLSVSTGLDPAALETVASEREDLAIVITGCDSGFGRALALELLSRGYTVFACCLQPDSAAALQHEADEVIAAQRARVGGRLVTSYVEPTSPSTSAATAAAGSRLKALPMDVTNDEQVAAAAAAVQGWTDLRPSRRRLLSVVNNAGVGTGGYVEWLHMADFERDCAVNYLGVVRVSKAFVPQLRRSAQLVAQRAAQRWKRPTASAAAPRMLVISSMSGKLPVPLLGSYSASKHASSAFAATLRMELAVWGIHVCTILPSFHRTPLLDSGLPSLRRAWAAASPQVRAQYGEPCFHSTLACTHQLMTEYAWDAARVTESLAGAATGLRAPPCELTIGSDAIFGLNLMRRLPAAVYEFLISTWICWNLVEPK